jgi:hypothetical protein
VAAVDAFRLSFAPLATGTGLDAADDISFLLRRNSSDILGVRGMTSPSSDPFPRALRCRAMPRARTLTFFLQVERRLDRQADEIRRWHYQSPGSLQMVTGLPLFKAWHDERWPGAKITASEPGSLASSAIGGVVGRQSCRQELLSA